MAGWIFFIGLLVYLFVFIYLLLYLFYFIIYLFIFFLGGGGGPYYHVRHWIPCSECISKWICTSISYYNK